MINPSHQFLEDSVRGYSLQSKIHLDSCSVMARATTYLMVIVHHHLVLRITNFTCEIIIYIIFSEFFIRQGTNTEEIASSVNICRINYAFWFSPSPFKGKLFVTYKAVLIFVFQEKLENAVQLNYIVQSCIHHHLRSFLKFLLFLKLKSLLF